MLLEREEQLRRLRHELAQAASGRGRLVAIAGEAGAGKTALTAAFFEEQRHNARILRAACEDLAIPDPLGPLYDLASEAGWSLDRVSQQEQGRIPLFAKAREIFELGDRPTILAIEDLHWADDATLDLVRFLGRRIGTSRVLLLLTARNDDREGQKRLRRALADVPADNVTRIDVPLLSEGAITELARSSGQDAGPIYRASAGNAFFATEMLRAGTAGLPPSVADATLTRADRLAARDREALDLVSVFPRRAEAKVLNHLLAGDEERLAACVHAGMLQPDGEGYAFRHEIARRAIEAALPQHRRQRLHAEVMAALVTLGAGSAARLAHHALAAGDPDAVRQHAPRAAWEASRIGAHREAAAHYQAMLALEQSFSPSELADLYGRYAFESHLIGKVPQAIAAQEKARAIHAEMGDRVMEGDSLRWLSRLSYLDARRHDADRYAAEAVRLLETQPPGAELAMAYSNLSQLAMLEDEPEVAIRHGKAAIALGEVLARPDIVSHALNNVGMARLWEDRELGRQEMHRSLELALVHNFQEHAARAYTNHGCFEANLMALSAARSIFEAGITYCIDRDLDVWRCYMQGWLADMLLRQGLWTEAGLAAGEVLQCEPDSGFMRYPALLVLARLRLRRGDPEIDPLLAEMQRFTAQNGEVQRLAPLATLLAERAWLGQGDRDEALAALQCAESLVPTRHLFGELVVWRRRLDPGSEIGVTEGIAPPYAAELAGNWRRAAELWREIGAPFDRAMALLAGDEGAQREALAIVDGLGARPVANRTRSLMRRNGIAGVAAGPRSTTRENALGLTRREMEVLRLVDRGLSSKRIAVELEISPKTVDHHVATLLEKLGAHSRGEARAAAREAGVLEG